MYTDSSRLGDIKAEKEKKEAQQKLGRGQEKAEAAEANKNAVSAQVSKLTSD